MGLFPCDVEQALHAEQSKALWATKEECFVASEMRVHEIPLSIMRGFVKDTVYDVHISCDSTVELGK
jgi:hypothetical protein